MHLTHSNAQPLPSAPSLFITSPLTTHRLGGSEQAPASRAQLSPSRGLRDATSNIYRLPLVAATATKRDEDDSDQLQLKRETEGPKKSKPCMANALKLNVNRDAAANAALKDALMIVKDDMVEKYLSIWPDFDQTPKMMILDPESPLMDIVPELDGEINFVSSLADKPLAMLIDGSVDIERKAITAQIQQAMDIRSGPQPIMLSQYNIDQLLAPTQFDTVHEGDHATGAGVSHENCSIQKIVQSSAIHGHLLTNKATVDFEGWNDDKGADSVITKNGVQTMYMSASSRHHMIATRKQDCVLAAVLCAMAPIVLPSLAVIQACDKLGLLENMKKDLDES